jgi:transposase
MAQRKKSSRSRAVPATPGSIARSARGTLRSYTVGALPIIDHILKRMKLEEFLQDYLPKEHRRSKIAAARDRRLQRAEQELRQLQQKLRSPRSRHRDPGKVQDAVAEILKTCEAASLIQVQVEECPRDTYHQQRPGRPGKDTVYVKETSMRLDLHYTVDAEAVSRERLTDGLFPLVTNDLRLSALDVLHAYKRQPQIERRFEQLKTDFSVAPVFLKDVGRIEAFLCVYFFALLAEALLERELRRAMERECMESLPLYPEGRDCRRPTTRRLIDVFAPLQRHVLSRRGEDPVVLLTELAPLHRKILHLLGFTTTIYR